MVSWRLPVAKWKTVCLALNVARWREVCSASVGGLGRMCNAWAVAGALGQCQ